MAVESDGLAMGTSDNGPFLGLQAQEFTPQRVDHEVLLLTLGANGLTAGRDLLQRYDGLPGLLCCPVHLRLFASPTS